MMKRGQEAPSFRWAVGGMLREVMMSRGGPAAKYQAGGKKAKSHLVQKYEEKKKKEGEEMSGIKRMRQNKMGAR